MDISEEATKRFWEGADKKDDPDECWEWKGPREQAGYGLLFLNNEKIKAHRYSLQIKENKLLNSKDFACHHCDNPPCVNPNHLYIGNAKSNVRDAVKRNRWSNGNLKKTHCKRGHEFTEQNTRLNPRGERICKACDREIQNKRRSTPEGRAKYNENARKWKAKNKKT